MGQMALWKRQKAVGQLLAPSRALPFPRPALLSQEDRVRTVLPLQLEQANPQTREQLSTRSLGNSPLPPSQPHHNPFSVSQRSLPGAPLVSKAPAGQRG